MESLSELPVLIHRRDCLVHELNVIVGLGAEARINFISVPKFMVSCTGLTRIQDQFENIQGQIEAREFLDSKVIDPQHANIRSAFNDLIRDILAIKYEIEINQATDNNHHSDIKPNRSLVKLPNISIPPFSGDFKQWKSFSDLFTSLIDSNPDLSDVAKYQYLLSFVRGEACRLLKGIPLTHGNYKKAWSILEYNYNNERLIAMHHMEVLYKLPSINSPSASTLRVILTGFAENLGALESLGFPVNEWDFMLYYLLYKKIDPETRRNFERTITSNRIPKFSELREFLDREVISWESAKSVSGFRSHQNNFVQPKSSSLVASNSKSCVYCHKTHDIISCSSFKNKKAYDRFLFVKSNRLCLKCLHPMHKPTDFCSKICCSICKATHHNTLLHFAKGPTDETEIKFGTSISKEEPNASDNAVSSLCSSEALKPRTQVVLLSTALIRIQDSTGKYQSARALIDSGSEVSFISETLVHRLGLKRRKLNIPIAGINDVLTNVKGEIQSFIKARGGDDTTSLEFRALVLSNITTHKPSYELNPQSWAHLNGLMLADPYFYKPSSVDILIGSDLYDDILLGDSIRGPTGTPIAISTSLGWILVGKVNSKFVRSFNHSSVDKASLSLCASVSIDSIVRRFWEVESIPDCRLISPDDQTCEDIFVRSHRRDSSGRYIVSLPFRYENPNFGDSRSYALKRLHSMERRFVRDDNFRQLYVHFMTDYLQCGHMELVDEPISGSHYFIPHHGILRPGSATTKLRVVFDASARTSNHISLNDTQFIGTKLQKDVSDLLCSFRLHKFAFTADIRQMYRQILISPEHQNYQLILWRENPDINPRVYRLKTVTYGLASSPFLAIRVLQQLADDHQSDYPDAAAILRRYTYMDDVIAGANSIESAIHLQTQLISLLSLGGFELRKWSTNSNELLRSLPSSVKEMEAAVVNLDEDHTTKVLGIAWDPSRDIFLYKVKPLHVKETKRTILAEIARIFDPLGFLSPVVITAKIIIQELWLAGVDWDSEVPENVRLKWIRFASEFPSLSTLNIPRYIPVKDTCLDLHGFCDSSESAYAAVIYIRFVRSDGSIGIAIVASKSRVAPLKRLSLPRLELCGALLLTKLFVFIRKVLKPHITISSEFAWTDSSIVLTWLRASPHNWTTFVANRVSEIQEVLAPECWRHVRSSDNPADCASRGLSPSQILDHPLWWSGPKWLLEPKDCWPVSSIDLNSEVPEHRSKQVVSLVADQDQEPNIFFKYSSFNKLIRVFAYCQRFINASRHKSKRNFGSLTSGELRTSRQYLVRALQSHWFAADIKKIKLNLPCSNSIRRLNPFLDTQGIIRVGGRIKNSKFDFGRKHPMLLPADSCFTKLLVDFYHQINLHSGLQATLTYIVQEFWILSARRVVKKRIFLCTKCYRQKATSIQPLMADLPDFRVQQLRPFVKVALDYAGPITTKFFTARSSKICKSYIAVFVCVCTRAVHIELISDLTTNSFIAGLRRFISRRGLCSDLVSDCGRNFVGASKELKALFHFVKSNQHLISDSLSKYNIQWHFNPPAAPHFNGLAEAAVKSIKSHLVRIVGLSVLTFEEMTTLLTQIESILNSRPICPLSSDAHDLQALTPGHFLIGVPLNSLPEPDLQDIKLNRLSRWQMIQQFVQRFWNRWHNEYLHTLQQRGKWTNRSENIRVGALVLLKDENSAPLQWKMGRVTEVYPSKDGVVRSVTLKTTQGTFRRPAHKLCPLPNNSD